jgi:hypothetical protein
MSTKYFHVTSGAFYLIEMHVEWFKFCHIFFHFIGKKMCAIMKPSMGFASTIPHTCDLHTCIYVKLTIISL